MLTKTFIATAVAAAIAAGSLGLSTTAASAHGHHHPHFGIGIGFGPGFYGAYAGGGQVCEPVVKNVKWYDKWGNKHWTTKVVGQNCYWQPYYPYY
jgi:hypothetical protein